MPDSLYIHFDEEYMTMGHDYEHVGLTELGTLIDNHKNLHILIPDEEYRTYEKTVIDLFVSCHDLKRNNEWEHFSGQDINLHVINEESVNLHFITDPTYKGMQLLENIYVHVNMDKYHYPIKVSLRDFPDKWMVMPHEDYERAIVQTKQVYLKERLEDK